MRFTNVEAHGLSSPIDPPREYEFHGGVRRIHKRDAVLVVVETATGMRGYAPSGASSSAMYEFFEGTTQDTFVDVITDLVAPDVEGTDVTEPADIEDLVGGLNLPTRVESQVGAALDIAYHDLLGKRCGAPIKELIGDDGRADDRLPLYASGGMYMPPRGYVTEAKSAASRGFRGYKYRPGLGPADDLRTVELLVETVGDELDLMVDAHTWWKLGKRSYDRETVLELATEFERHGVRWLEEPVPPTDHEGYVELSEATGVPLAGGESEESTDGLRRLVETGAVAYLQGDVRHHWGYTGCLDAIAACEGTGTTFVPHHFGTDLGLVANAHLVASLPETPLLEYPLFETGGHPGMYPNPLASDVLSTEVVVTDGRLRVPDGPGLGVEVDLDVVEKYPYVDGPWTEFVYDT